MGNAVFTGKKVRSYHADTIRARAGPCTLKPPYFQIFRPGDPLKNEKTVTQSLIPERTQEIENLLTITPVFPANHPDIHTVDDRISGDNVPVNHLSENLYNIPWPDIFPGSREHLNRNLPGTI